MTGYDLGTYHVRVVLNSGDGFIYTWETGARYTDGNGGIHPLTAQRIVSHWRGEQELFGTMLFAFTEGNYSCDCNKRIFLARASRSEEPEELECGDLLAIRELVAIRPDGTEFNLFDLA